MKQKDRLIASGQTHIMNTYAQFPIILERGEGIYVYDNEGKKYLDFVAGIAVNSLGHGNINFAKALSSQAEKLTHCSNLFWNEPCIELAEKLTSLSGLNRAFFCNSGAEAIESALKLSRKYGKLRHKECVNIITMQNSFHGRTYGAISATGQTKYQKGLEPLLPNILHSAYNDFESLNKIVNENTCAIIMELIQGEGGVNPANKKFVEQIRSLCTEKNIVLVFDEVQTGIGRTGEMFAFQAYDVEPDLVALAKGLGNGFPIGVLLAKENIAKAFAPGDHASTFGGNPLATTAANFVLDTIAKHDILDNVRRQGQYLITKLQDLQKKYPNLISDVRGIGLILGLELKIEVKPILSHCLENGVLLIGAGTHIIRFVPPLIVNKTDIDFCVNTLEQVFANHC